MAFMLYSVDDAIDNKFIITKSISHQAKPGTLIHVMDATHDTRGISLDYRVTGTDQDYTVTFHSLKQLCKWIQPDSFIARHYESLDSKDVIHYMKVNSHSFVSFCLPLILVFLAVIWCAYFFLVPMVLPSLYLPNLTGLIIGAALSVIVICLVCIINKVQKSNAKMKIWSSVADNKWGIKIT
ncbi:MAG: hypothetical protein J1F11_03170 [Oscillospiraceae bacterium]|nr:hypothetical protein [Oscillospiraceae bacterium]